ncbi:hypothetical protein P4S72_16260 [Vibrio sp. PP-XX7]
MSIKPEALQKFFACQCGSDLPYISSSGKSLIVPAGSLGSESTKQPDAQIFCHEETNWHLVGLQLRKSILDFPTS